MQDYSDLIIQFEEILGKDYVLYDAESKDKYAHDETENLHFLPIKILKYFYPNTPIQKHNKAYICSTNLPS